MPINLFELAAAPAAISPATRAKGHGRSLEGLGPMAGNRQASGMDRNQPDPTRAVTATGKAGDISRKASADKADDRAQDPFVAVIREAVTVLNKAVKATQPADESAPSPELDTNTALALLAQLTQFAQVLPGMSGQLPETQLGQDPQGVVAAIAGTSGLPSLMSGTDGQLRLDPQLLQALFGQANADQAAADANFGMTAPGHLPIGQPLQPEMMAELQDLRAQMGQLQQQLAALLKEHGSPAIQMPSGDAAPPADAAPTEDPALPVNQQPVMAPVQPATVPAPAPAAPTQAPATAPVQAPAASQRQAAIDMLLKPMRGELTVEKGGDFALKGLRTDVAYQQPADTADLLQNLVEQGKQVANQLPEGTDDLADAMGIRLAGDQGDTAIPVAQTEAGNLLLDALTDEAVTAATDSDAVTDRAEEPTNADSESIPAHREDLAAGPFTLGKAEASSGIPSSEGPRAQQAVMQQVIDKVKELAPGPAQVRMVLNPESLGQVTIRLVAHQGEVSVRIITDNPDAHKLLDGGMNHLKTALADSGIKLDQATVINVAPQEQQRQEGAPQQHQQPQPEQQGREPQREASPDELAALEELTALMQGRSLGQS
jgi:flagellar hook-length control protein FliK